MEKDYTYNLLPARATQRGYGGPILVIALAVVAWIFIAFAAFAQSSNSESSSEASTNTEVETLAIAGSQINNYGQRPGSENKTYAEVSTAPSLGGLALGGGHPCAYSPATAQISVIGGGAGIGGSKVDSACMLMVMGAAGDKQAYRAAQLMLAARDPGACLAMEQVGLVQGCDPRKRGGSGTAVATASTAETKKDWSKSSKSVAVVTGYGAKCEMVGKKIKFRPTSAAARDAELANCKSRF
jgi:hypothetical protein